MTSSMERGATPPRAIRWTDAIARHVGFPARVPKSAPGGGIPAPGVVDGTLHVAGSSTRAQAARPEKMVRRKATSSQQPSYK
jgi:hypothetical protein